jgi:predicted nucleic acid-binding protein
VPVVDASVVVDWVAPDADPQGPARRFLDELVRRQAAIQAPRLLMEEVANALLTGVRRNRWTGGEADDAFDLLSALPVGLVDNSADLRGAWELSRRYDEHPVYDMVYVALADRLAQEFVTADARLLARLAGRRNVVGLA